MDWLFKVVWGIYLCRGNEDRPTQWRRMCAQCSRWWCAGSRGKPDPAGSGRIDPPVSHEVVESLVFNSWKSVTTKTWRQGPSDHRVCLLEGSVHRGCVMLVLMDDPSKPVIVLLVSSGFLLSRFFCTFAYVPHKFHTEWYTSQGILRRLHPNDVKWVFLIIESNLMWPSYNVVITRSQVSGYQSHPYFFALPLLSQPLNVELYMYSPDLPHCSSFVWMTVELGGSRLCPVSW
jgi:hypothetical protein